MRSPILSLILIVSMVMFVPTWIAGCQGNKQEALEPSDKHELSGKRILMVIAPDKFRDEELFTPREYFLARGAKVEVASSASGEVSGMLGRTYRPEKKLSEVKADDYDAIIFVGGVGAQAYYDNPDALKLAQSAFQKGKVIGAICLAPGILAKAGVLKGRSATSFRSARKILVEGGARFIEQHCVRDGKIITADGPASAEEFAATIARALMQ